MVTVGITVGRAGEDGRCKFDTTEQEFDDCFHVHGELGGTRRFKGIINGITVGPLVRWKSLLYLKLEDVFGEEEDRSGAPSALAC
jgi:hypothetical protein